MWATLGVASALAGPARVVGGAEIGGAVLGNLSADPDGGTVDAWTADAVARLGAAARLGRVQVSATGRCAGRWVPAVPDLTGYRAGLGIALAAPLTWRWRLVGAPSAEAAWYGDPARDEVGGGGRLGVEYRAHPRVDLELAGSGWATRAADPVFSDLSAAGQLAGRFRPTRTAELSGSVGLQRGRVVRYLEPSDAAALARTGQPGAGGTGGAGGHGADRPSRVVDTFGADVVATAASATGLDLGVEVGQELGPVVHLRGFAQGSRLWAEPAAYDVFTVGIRLGAHL